MAIETIKPDEASLDGERRLERLQQLTEGVGELADSRARDLLEELMGLVLELYGDGLARIVAVLQKAGVAGEEIKEQLADDSVVASLLLIHDLYPVDLRTRVDEALATVRPYMESHGGDVELLGLDDGIARLRLVGHCKGCPASSATLEHAIKEALEEAAPDLAGLEVEGVAETRPRRAVGTSSADLIPLTVVQGGASPEPLAAPTWLPLDSVGTADPGQLRTISAGGVEFIVAGVDGNVLAYRSSCAQCGAGLADAVLAGAILTCAGCGHEFDLPRAGRSVAADDLQLEPVPLLRRAAKAAT